jgi:hypothetical protein
MRSELPLVNRSYDLLGVRRPPAAGDIEGGRARVTHAVLGYEECGGDDEDHQEDDEADHDPHQVGLSDAR